MGEQDDIALELELNGCVRYIESIRLRSEAEYLETCKIVAGLEQEAIQKLIEIAPAKLGPALQGPLRALFAYKSTSFELKAGRFGGGLKTVKLLAQLAQAWQGIVKVHTTINSHGPKFAVHIYAE